MSDCGCWPITDARAEALRSAVWASPGMSENTPGLPRETSEEIALIKSVWDRMLGNTSYYDALSRLAAGWRPSCEHGPGLVRLCACGVATLDTEHPICASCWNRKAPFSYDIECLAVSAAAAERRRL